MKRKETDTGCETKLHGTEMDAEGAVNETKRTTGLAEWIQSLDVPQWVKDALERVRNFVVVVKDKVVLVGGRILRFVRSVAERCPDTALTVLVFAALAWLAASVPVLNALLLPIVMAAGAITIPIVLLNDLSRSPAARAALRDLGKLDRNDE